MQDDNSVTVSGSVLSDIIGWWHYTMTLPTPEMAIALFNALLVIAFFTMFFLGVWWVGCWATNDVIYSARRSMKGAQEREEQFAREVIAERIRREGKK